jgi:hypothetical protein
MANPIERWQREASAGVAPVEYRNTPRFPILQRCLVQVQGASGGGSWRCIAFNVSVTGIGLTLPCSLQAGTVLEIKAWELPAAPVLKAKVVHSKLVEFTWFCGCELIGRLSDTELQAWMSGPLDWLAEAQAG